MRLVRLKRPPERNGLLVGEGSPPQWDLTTARDLEQLFLEMYHRLHGRLLNHAERFLSKEDARDAVADAVASLWVRWSSLSQEKRADKYAFGAVHYSVSAKLRKDSQRVSLEDAEPELDQRATHAVSERAHWDGIAEVLDEALAAMTPRRREVLLLVHEERFSYQDAADALGISMGSFRTHIRLANEDLRAAFARAGYRIANPQRRQLPSPQGGTPND